MSALDGFYATWSKARDTFGEGTPQTGEQFDASPQLSQAQATLDRAAPGSQWTGAGANAYGAANTRHQEVIGGIGALDKRLAAQVTYSAEVVAHGRTQLDDVRKWVTDAAASVPPGKDQDQKLLPIANKGIGEVVGIVQKTNSELGNVGGKIRALSAEYDRLGMKAFVSKEGPGDPLGATGDKSEEEERRQAEKDVHDALAGDQGAAERVDEVLQNIKPGQQLTPEQASYLSQMQAQQHGMTVPQLKKAEERLGARKNIIGDSWQLMSNDDVYFPKTDLERGALDDPTQVGKGNFEQLPQSVQDILSQNGLASPAVNSGDVNDVKAIAQIVKDGHSELQTGTELDRSMMRLSDRIMDDPNAMTSQHDVVTDIFDSAGRDHTIVRDMVTGIKGDDGDDFLNDINNCRWDDDGKSAGDLFRWTNELAHSPDPYTAQIAAETAEKVAQYVGTHDDELLHMPNGFSDTTLGQANPELVRAYAHGLTPYMADIASLNSADKTDEFGFLDPGNSERPTAKGLFAVLGTDQQAYEEFHGAANAQAVIEAQQYANDVKNGVHVKADDARLLDVGVLKGLTAAGSTEAAHATGMNNDQLNDWRKGAYAAGIATLGLTTGGVGGVALSGFGAAMESSIMGPDASGNGNDLIIPNMGADESARLVLNAMIAQGVEIPGMDQLQPFMKNGEILALSQLDPGIMPADTGYQDLLNGKLNEILHDDAKNPSEKISQKYEDIVKIPGGK